MQHWIEQIPHRRLIYFCFALLVFGSSAAEIINEILLGQSAIEMFDDVSLFILSGLIVGLFIVDYHAQQQSLGRLQSQLDSARGQLEAIDSSSSQLATQYREVMQKQFDVWQLTGSEQDVVLGLLKGLSFREIAELRDTREKTVRQQATSVYRKAGVAGRHELAAWFFEDMLDTTVSVSNAD